MPRVETLVIEFDDNADLTEISEAMKGERQLLGGRIICWRKGNASKELEEKQTWIECLEEAGVDNWHGYEYAQEALKERKTFEAALKQTNERHSGTLKKLADK